MDEQLAEPRTVEGLNDLARLYDDLVAGLAHDLAGRASALRSLAIVGRHGPPSGSFLTDELDTEADALERLALAFRALPALAADPAARSVVSVGELVRGLVELLGCHHEIDAEDLEVHVDPGTPAVHVAEPALARLVLLLAADAASSGRCRIEVGPGGGDVSEARMVIRGIAGTDALAALRGSVEEDGEATAGADGAPPSGTFAGERGALTLAEDDLSVVVAAGRRLGGGLARIGGADERSWELRLPAVSDGAGGESAGSSGSDHPEH